MLLPILNKKIKLKIDGDILENFVMRELIKHVLHPLSSETTVKKKVQIVDQG